MGAGLSLNVTLRSRWRVLRPFSLNVVSKVAQFRLSQHGVLLDRPALLPRQVFKQPSRRGAQSVTDRT